MSDKKKKDGAIELTPEQVKRLNEIVNKPKK